MKHSSKYKGFSLRFQLYDNLYSYLSNLVWDAANSGLRNPVLEPRTRYYIISCVRWTSDWLFLYVSKNRWWWLLDDDCFYHDSWRIYLCVWQENKINEINVKYSRIHVHEYTERTFASNPSYQDRKPKYTIKFWKKYGGDCNRWPLTPFSFPAPWPYRPQPHASSCLDGRAAEDGTLFREPTHQVLRCKLRSVGGYCVKRRGFSQQWLDSLPKQRYVVVHDEKNTIRRVKMRDTMLWNTDWNVVDSFAFFTHRHQCQQQRHQT